MPKSKRERVVHLTKTKKKGAAQKTKLIENIHESVLQYSYAYIFEMENVRNTSLKQIRAHWSTSRFFLGKNKVMHIALGRSEQDEFKPSLHRLANRLRGNRGLFFTNSQPAEVLKFFEQYSEPNFARSGFVAPRDVTLDQGVLDQPASNEPLLRKLGLTTKLDNGKVVLEQDTAICSEGDVLTPEQCKLLELFGLQLAVFRIHIVSYWHDGKVVSVKDDSELKSQGQDAEVDDDGESSLQLPEAVEEAEDAMEEEVKEAPKKAAKGANGKAKAADKKQKGKTKATAKVGGSKNSKKKGDKNVEAVELDFGDLDDDNDGVIGDDVVDLDMDE